jgi:hypothetical protein
MAWSITHAATVWAKKRYSDKLTFPDSNAWSNSFLYWLDPQDESHFANLNLYIHHKSTRNFTPTWIHK